MLVRPAHTFFAASIFAMCQHMNNDYVSKMVYNKDKDLVFVYRPDGLWGEQPQMRAAPVTAVADLTMNRDDGI